MDPNLTETNTRIQKAKEHLKLELAAIRAGRANPSLVENILVDVYGSKMKLMELGTISAPQHQLLIVQVWDASIVSSVAKAIMESNLGLNPAVEGTLIRLPIPSLSAERRQEFVKLTHQKMEEVRVEVRQIRQDSRNEWARQQELGEISEDEKFRREKLLQDLIDKTIDEIEELGKKKEAELVEI